MAVGEFNSVSSIVSAAAPPQVVTTTVTKEYDAEGRLVKETTVVVTTQPQPSFQVWS